MVNVGSDEEVSIMELAERVKRITGSGSEIVTVPYSEAYEAGSRICNGAYPISPGFAG